MAVTSLVVQMVKNVPTVWETWALSLVWEDPLEKRNAIHSSILAWRLPWTEEPSGLQSRGSLRVGHHWVTNTLESSRELSKSSKSPRIQPSTSESDLQRLNSDISILENWLLIFTGETQVRAAAPESQLRGSPSPQIHGGLAKSLCLWHLTSCYWIQLHRTYHIQPNQMRVL